MPFHRPIPGQKETSIAKSGLSAYVQAEKLAQIALVLPCAVVVGWLAGAWADKHFHQSWLVLVGIVLGSIAGLTSAVQMALSAGAGAKKEGKQGDGSSSPDSGSGS
jgi:F0F1-type ATP synthase assembly protein I